MIGRALALACLLGAAPLHAETRWVSDEFTVQIRSEPSSESAPAGQGVDSGTALELVGDADRFGFVHVRTAEGVEGWIAARYLVDQPTARSRLEAANERIAELEAQLTARDDEDDAVLALNARLRSEVDALIEERDALRESREQRGMWLGAGLLLAGLLVGILVKARPRRSGWS